MTTVYYQLINAFENYKEFDNYWDAEDWIEGIGEEMFIYFDIVEENE